MATPGATGVLVRAICFWDFWLAATGISFNGVNESVDDFFFASSGPATKAKPWELLVFKYKYVSRGRYSEGNSSFLNQTIQSNLAL